MKAYCDKMNKCESLRANNEYFYNYKAMVDEYGIQTANQWKFDETGY